VTREEVEAKMRANNLEKLEQVKAMYLEGDGTFTVIKATG
jgi:uncharacterized membrane protein YcaP (DUF421 family)